MSTENKPTTRRRPIAANSKPQMPKPAAESVERPTVVTPEKEYEVPVTDSPEVETPVVPPPIPEESIEKEKTDEEWAEEIARVKQQKEADVTPKVEEPQTPVTQPADPGAGNPHDPMEAEIQRRVNERLRAMNAKETKADPLATKAEQTEAEKELNDKNEEERQKRVAEQNDASTYVHLPLGTTTEFNDAFEAELAEDERTDKERSENPTPYEAGMALTRQLGQANNQHRLLKTWIAELLEKNASGLQRVANEMRLARVTPKIGDGSTGPKKLSGSTARAAVISRIKGMYRVQLYNSGFWLDIRTPALIDIDGWMSEVDTEFKELGRVLGGHAHGVIDIFLKQKFFEILPDMVQRSNFEDYADPDKLISNISFHDYDTLLWAFCCMMYKDGIGAGIYCTNPECRYIDEHQYIDLRNICFLNTEAFTPKAMEWMNNGAHAGSKMLTEADLARYRNEILGYTKTLTFDDGRIVYELQVPTVRQFIEEGSTLVSKLETILHGKHDITTDAVSNQLTYHLYKMLSPWIKILNINDDKGNLVYRIEDRQAIYDSLDINQFENSDIYQQITDFIRDTKISFYSATTLRCPKCGKVADLEHDNMFPLDMQYLFF